MSASLSTLRLLMILAAVAGILGLFIHGPILQWSDYHNFADKRTIGGISNFADTVSNGIFIVGWLYLFSKIELLKKAGPNTPGVLYHGMAFFLIAVCAGSAYYHLDPNNQRLVWDRLPIAVFFTLIFVHILYELNLIKSTALNLGLVGLYVLFAILSPFLWVWTDDLRYYVFVQFYPLVALLMLLPVCAMRPELRGFLKLFAILLVGYGLAKLCEKEDHSLWYLTNETISGHTLKHLFAGLTAIVYFKVKSAKAV